MKKFILFFLYIISSSNYLYASTNFLYADNMTKTQLTSAYKDVMQNNSIYTIDQNNNKNRELFYGIGFHNADNVIISRHKGKIMFTPASNEMLSYALNSVKDINIKEANSNYHNEEESVAQLPEINFYVFQTSKINDDDCKFPAYDFGNTSPCKNANVSLVYLVTMARSKAYSNNSAPEGKILRISIDDNSSGTGITLNTDGAVHSISYAPDKYWHDGTPYGDAYDHGPAASSYTFDIHALDDSSNHLRILSALPTNHDPQYTHTDVNSMVYGVAASSLYTPATTAATLAITSTKQLMYNTNEYDIATTAPNDVSKTFSWVRSQYATADSMVDTRSSTVFWNNDAFNAGHISAIGYNNFIPNLDVIFLALLDIKDPSTINISTKINIRDFMEYSVFMVMWYTYSGWENNKDWKTVALDTQFTVNWNNPVFIGSFATNLQPNILVNQCISVDESKNISLATCDESSAQQSFVYDSNNRYVSVNLYDEGGATYCLDTTNINKISRCSQANSQFFNWDLLGDDRGGRLYDVNHNYIGVKNNQLVITKDQAASLLISRFTKLYNLKTS